MGSHSGGGYMSSAAGVKTLKENIDRLAERYPLTPGGRFGNKGKNTQVVESDNPAATAKEFWGVLSKGGQPSPLRNGKGDRVAFADGSLVVHRPVTSTQGSPAIEVSTSTPSIGLPPFQKIHFILKGE